MSLPVWLNGELVPSAEARISPFDHGLLVGDGVFETMKVVDGVAFALTRHLGRLRRSAVALGLDMPEDAVLRAAVEAVLAAGSQAGGASAAVAGPGRVRITLTGGPGPLGSSRGEDGSTVLVAAGPALPWPASTAVVTVPWPRNERSPVAGVKTISYAENVVALAHAHERGAGEAVFANLAGDLCEGTGSNVFLGQGGQLCTPSLGSGCLAGITRELLLELTGADETDVPVDALEEADEAFLASSTREVQPVSTVDGTPLHQCPGPLTQRAIALFADLVGDNLDP